MLLSLRVKIFLRQLTTTTLPDNKLPPSQYRSPGFGILLYLLEYRIHKMVTLYFLLLFLKNDCQLKHMFSIIYGERYICAGMLVLVNYQDIMEINNF